MEVNAVGLKAGFDSYNTVRTPDQIDLVSQVRRAMESAGLINSVVTGFDQDPLIIDAVNKQPSVQQYILNCYWYRQLTSLQGVNTLDVRLNLIQNGEPEEWFRLFRENVLPFVSTHGLPAVVVPGI